MPDGELFDIITRGRGTMGGQSTFISVDDRWKIIAHLRSLQSDASP